MRIRYLEVLALALLSSKMTQEAMSTTAPEQQPFEPDYASKKRKPQAPQNKKRHIIAHRQHDKVPHLSAMEVTTLQLNDTHLVRFANLTDQEVKDLEKVLPKGAVQENGEVQLNSPPPQGNFTTGDMLHKNKAKTQPYLRTPHACKNAPVSDKIIFAWMDTVINSKLPVFNGVKFIGEKNFISNTRFGNPHGAYTLAEAVGRNGKLGYGTIYKRGAQVYKIGVFNYSGGFTTDEILIQAFLFLADMARTLTATTGQKIVANLSISGGRDNPLVNEAIKQARDAGVYISLSAGNTNSGRCNVRVIPGVPQTGATYPNGYTLEAAYTNWGPCVASFLCGDIKTFNGKKDIGTSFAAPPHSGRAYAIWGLNYFAAIWQVLEANLQGMYTYLPTTYPNYQIPTKVMPTSNYCVFPKIEPLVIPAQLFAQLSTGAAQSDWFPTNQTSNFCVNYIASTNNAASTVKFQNYYSDSTVTLTVGAKTANPKKFTHSLEINGIVVDSITNDNRIIGSKPVLFRVQQNAKSFKVTYGEQTLFDANVSAPLFKVAFSGKGNTYRNAAPC